MSKFNSLRFVNSCLRLSYLAVIFILPLVFAAWFHLDNLFILPKLSWFWFLLSVLIFLTGWKLVLSKKIENWKGLFKYWLLPGLFVIFLGVSSYFSNDVSQAFYGSYDRQSGWLMYFSLFLWLVTLTLNWKIDSKIFRLPEIFRTIGLSGLFVSLYGILQYFGYDIFIWPEPPVLYRRAFSTLGQPNFLGSFLLFSIPISAYLLSQAKRNWIKIFWIFSLIISLAALAFSLSRSAWLGLLVGIALGLVVYFVSTRKKRLNRQIIIPLVILLALVIGIFSQDFFWNRVKSSFDVSNGSVAMRLIYWQSSWDKIKEQPVLGYGLEQQKAVLRDSYNKEWAVHEKINSYSDRAHNVVLDYLLIGGLVSLILLILWWRQLFILSLRMKVYRREALTILIALTSYGVALLFSFETIVDMVYFWLLAAILISLFLQENSPSVHIKNSIYNWKKGYKIIILSLLFIGIIVVGTSCLNNLIGNHYFFKSKQALFKQDYAVAALLYNYSLEKSPQQPHYSYYFADALSFMFLENKTVIDKVWELELNEVYDNLDSSSYDDLLAQARIKTLLGDYGQAEEKYLKTIILAPELPKTYVNLASLYSRQENYDQALKYYDISLDKLPPIDDPRINSTHIGALKLYVSYIRDKMGQSHLSLKEFNQAQGDFQLAFNSNVFDLRLLKKIADSYYLAGDLDKAIWYNQRGQLRAPEDPVWPTALAFLYFENDKKVLARENLNQALELQADYYQALELSQILEF